MFRYPRIKERFHPREKTIRRFFRLVSRKAILTRDLYSIDRITDDPSDNIFLACAMEAKADYIVSRGSYLRNLKHFQGIDISSLKTFFEKLRK